jgi:hypothetical protein
LYNSLRKRTGSNRLSAGGRNLVIALCIFVFLSGLAEASGQAKPPKLKAAAQVPTTASPHIEVNHMFTAAMADSAGLDSKEPTLSADGVRSGTVGTPPAVQKVASTECLFAETLVQEANSLDAHAVAQYCAHTATDSKTYDDVFTGPDTGTATKMQEALVHIVVWSKGQWSGTWYRYERNSKSGQGVLLSLGSANAITSPPTHLLGKGGLGFLAIHINIDDSCGIGYDVTAKHTRPLNQQDVIDLISLAEGYASKGKTATKGGPPLSASPGIGIWGGQLLIATGPLPATVTFTPSLKQGAKVSAISLAKPEKGQPPGWQVENSCTASPKPTEVTPQKAQSIDTTTNEDLRGGNLGLSPQSQTGPWVRSDSSSLYRRVALFDGESQPPAAALALEDHSTSSERTSDENGGDLKGPGQNNEQKNGGGQNPPAQNGGAQNGGAQNTKNNQASNSLANAALSIPDEGFYWWDVSVALPVTSFNQLNYSSVNNTVIVKNTNDIKPYALFDTYLGKSDLRMQNAISKPFFAAGVPMAGKPLQKPFFGGGLVLALKSFHVQTLVGVRVEKDLRSSLTAGQSATPAQVLESQYSEWHAKLQVMVGFSVGDAAKVLGLTAKKQGSN